MRIALTLSLLAFGATAAAAQSLDRYGYGVPGQAGARSLEARGYQALSWTNKAQPAPQAAAQPYAVAALTSPARSYPAFQPQAPYQAAGSAPVPAPAPNRVSYAAPPVEPPMPDLAGAPAAPAPQATAHAPPPPAPAPAPQRLAQSAAGGSPVRYYSLHRAYGLTPDAIPEDNSAPHYVLIAPTEAKAPPADDGDDDASPREKPY